MTVPRRQQTEQKSSPKTARKPFTDHALVCFAHDLIAGYGSFFFFTQPAANLLLVACTMMRPWVGLLGLLAGASTLLARQALSLSLVTVGGLEVVNGILAGLLVGYFFAPEERAVALALCAGPFAVLVSAWMGDNLRHRNLPLLSGSFVLVGGGLLAVGRAMGLSFAPPLQPTPIDWLPTPLYEFLRALGGIYLTRTPEGGIFVLAALFLSSRTLVMLAILAASVANLILLGFAIPVTGLAGSSALSAAVMAAIMTGGLFTAPSGRALLVALFAAACASVASLALFNALFFMALPPLSLPYLVVTWLIMLTLRPERGMAWARYWLPPSLPEISLDRARQAEARGLSPHSVALRAPFYGRWHVYQSFDGPYTHQGAWAHALDFHRLVDGQAFRDDGEKVSDFYCFGQTVRSPAWGQVVEFRADLPDNPPGEVDAVNCWGNYVLIAIGNDEFVLIAHFRQHSVCVAMGETVMAGQHLGQCGNSGRSPQPHIHMHVQKGITLGNPTRPFHLSGVCIGTRFLLDCLPKEQDEVLVPNVSEALRRSLHVQIGRRHTYMAGQNEWQLQIELDVTNQFTFVAASGAKVYLAETDTLFALYERCGPADPLFDVFVLSVGLTPMIDMEAEWFDAPPTRLLPLPPAMRALRWLLPGMISSTSHYRRAWDSTTHVWRQSGTHDLNLLGRPLWRCQTLSTITEGGGIIGFSLAGSDHLTDVKLIKIGFKSDIGVDEWDEPVVHSF
ncbi:MAG: urea transporter [Magnetococcales bacterium]|nr:urea transporter [Magnetococcales bacterium]MBF0116233.1 urea transporter [Magnetococcales bacterium]